MAEITELGRGRQTNARRLIGTASSKQATHGTWRLRMYFEIVGRVRSVETIAVGRSIRDLARLRRLYGRGRWRKPKGVARVRLPDGFAGEAEVHGYEAAGIGKREMKDQALSGLNEHDAKGQKEEAVRGVRPQHGLSGVP
jgi:hypothetical protein